MLIKRKKKTICLANYLNESTFPNISYCCFFFFGIFFEMLNIINYKIIYNHKKIIKILFTFLIIFIQSLLYFYLLLKINNGIIHIYGIFSILVGMISFYYLQKIIKKFYKDKKK